MAKDKEHGTSFINWVLGIVASIVVVGIVGLLNLYGEVSSLRNTNRVNIKQWELIGILRTRVTSLEMKNAFDDGYKQAKSELNKTSKDCSKW